MKKQMTTVNTKKTPKQAYHSLIISDIHLGSKVLNYSKLLKVLNTVNFNRLIINGDLFDDGLHLNRLNTEHWAILSKIRELTKTKKVIFTIGNHDSNVGPIIDLLGVECHKDYVFFVRNKKYLITHGDHFDYFIQCKPFLTWAATGLYYLIQKFGGKKQTIPLYFKQKSKTWFKIHEKLRVRAIKFAQGHLCDVICCGHSHIAEEVIDQGVAYVNSGSFCDAQCHYILIDNKGNCELKEI